MSAPPASVPYGAAYYRGRTASNYRDYEHYQGRKLAWLLPLWLFTRLARRYAPAAVQHLDVGCALGHFCSYAHPHVSRTVGVDISPYAIARARALFPHLAFLESPAERLPFPSDAFHLVTAFDTLEHLREPDAALAEVRRVLRPGGALLARMPYAGLLRQCFGWRDRDPTHVSVLSWNAWQTCLTRAGLTVVRSLWYPSTIGGEGIFVARRPHAVSPTAQGLAPSEEGKHAGVPKTIT